MTRYRYYDIDPVESPFIGVPEAAAVAGVDETTIKRWLHRGTLPGVKLGKLWRIRRTDWDTFLTGGK